LSRDSEEEISALSENGHAQSPNPIPYLV